MTIADRPKALHSEGAASAPKSTSVAGASAPRHVDAVTVWSRTFNSGIELVPPPGVFYWAQLDGLPKRPSAYALRAAFEAWLPLPVDEVESRFVRTDQGGWIACGVERTTLQQWIGAATSNGEQVLTSIRPSAWPGIIDSPSEDAALPDFRSGSFACPSLARAKRRVLGVAVFTLVAIAAVACLALLGRAQALHVASANIEAQARPLITDALALSATLPASVDPRRLLTSELEALRQATDSTATNYRASGSTAPYLRLLAVWPADVPTRVDQLEVNESALRLTLSVRDHGDAERLVDALTTDDLPWTLGSRNIQQSPRPEDGVRVTLLLKRKATEGAGP